MAGNAGKHGVVSNTILTVKHCTGASFLVGRAQKMLTKHSLAYYIIMCVVISILHNNVCRQSSSYNK
jgi:hypothetical protein